MNRLWQGVAFGSAIFAGCGSNVGTVEAKGPSKFDFVDVAKEAGIDVIVECGNAKRWYIPESNGSGAAWLDYDNDGDMDLFIANGAKLVYVDDGKSLEFESHANGCRMYRNDGHMHFTDVTAEVLPPMKIDLVNAVATGDIDNDGDTDIYLACFGPDVLLRNEGGRFVDATKEAGLGCPLFGASAAFGDVDNDGDLDLYVANYVQFDLAHPPLGGKRDVVEGVEVGFGPEAENKQGLNVGAADVFYLNDGKGHFTDATKEAGLELEKPLCSYAVVFSDIDGDGWQDILVANDDQPCNLFHNLGHGRFKEEGAERGFAFNSEGNPTGAMGLSVEDFDQDGDFDVFRTNFDLEANSLHVNDGKGHFIDRAAEFGLAAPSMDKLGWGGGFFDADCDGDFDILVANGHVYPQASQIKMSPWLMPTQLYECFENERGSIAYRDVTAQAGSGLATLHSSRGVAFGDPDDDGDVDALVIDLDERPRLLENRSERRGHWLEVKLIGSKSNRDGYGAKIVVSAGGRAWTREMRTTSGLYCSHDPRLHFGLGPVSSIDTVNVHWPSGAMSSVDKPALDHLLVVREASESKR